MVNKDYMINMQEIFKEECEILNLIKSQLFVTKIL